LNFMDECCCTPGGPPQLLIARAVSIVTVLTFHIHSDPGFPFFCGRRFFRQCSVTSFDNGRCGFAVPNQDGSAAIPIFALRSAGTFDPCSASDTLDPQPPGTFADAVRTCRLSPGGGLDCWDATYTLTVETFPNDIIAACLSNLALIDLAQVPFGTQRTVFNNIFNGEPSLTDFPIASNPPLPDACPLAGNSLAASFAFRYQGSGSVAHCNTRRDTRIRMPTYTLVASASRSRFSSNSTWCKRTLGPILIDPNFDTVCNSQPGPCAQTACAHHLPATGIIDAPGINQSIHISLCTNPAAPCNPTPNPFP
jgi:hypothetical protein